MSDPAPIRRADAQRNRERLIAAAADVFAERGPDAPLDEIAKRAGVGNATLYRHFPDRRDLVIAVYSDEVDALGRLATQLLDEHPPGDALWRWLEAFAAHVSARHGLARSVGTVAPESPLFREWHAAIHAAAEPLVDHAKAVGALRGDVEPAELTMIASGIALTAPGPLEVERLLGIVRVGCAPR